MLSGPIIASCDRLLMADSTSSTPLPESGRLVFRTADSWRLPRQALAGHNLPVRVTFQFLLVVRPVIVLNVRYSASNLMTSLPQSGHYAQFETMNR